MTSKRNLGTGRSSRPVPFLSDLAKAAAAFALASSPLAVTPVAASTAAVQTSAPRAAASPSWFAQGPGAAESLIMLLDTAGADGLDPARYRTDRLRRALGDAQRGNPRAVRKAEQSLNQALVAYVRDLRRPSDVGITYVDAQLRPTPPSPQWILAAAAAAPSLRHYVANMAWMHPTYFELRQAMTRPSYDAQQRQLIAINLERARQLPSSYRKHVVMNAAAQRLYMYENGQVVDSMRVVVGKPKYATPMMSAFIRYAALNPYWNVPPDLTAERIAPNVRKQGAAYLRRLGYEVLSDWGPNPNVVDPATIDWKAVADGSIRIRVRQLPGPHNAMGQMKFMFPNIEGVYLHDTPEKELLTEASRLFSGGCVRLEDAPRLGRWLFGTTLNANGAEPEQPVPLANPVPVYLTYLTAVPSGSSVAFFDDIYGRDAVRLAQPTGATALSSAR